MRVAIRSLSVALMALIGVVVLGVAWTMTTAIQLVAATTTALIMGGTQHPLVAPTDQPPFVTSYLNSAVNDYLNTPEAMSAGLAGPVNNAVAVFTPEQLFPLFGTQNLDQSVAVGRANLHNCLQASNCVFNNDPEVQPDVGSVPPMATDQFVVFGRSQSAVIASLVKRDLINNPPPAAAPSVSFALVSNPMRPNGGILERFNGFPRIPVFGISFYGAAPTNSPVVNDGGTPGDPSDDTFLYPTVDVAQQYDSVGGDFPARPLNPLATINSIAASYFYHGNVVNQPISDALFQGRLGDTTYYIFPTPVLPILIPLQRIGVPTPIVDVLDTVLRPIIEDSYNRTVNPGVPVPVSFLPIGNPIGLAVNLVLSIPVAIDNALQDLGVGRLLGTTRPGLFGVGGPALPDPPATTMSVSALSVQAPVVQKNDTESVAPEAKSLIVSAVPTPAAGAPVNPKAPDPEPVSGPARWDAATTVESTITASGSTTQQQADPGTPKANTTPASTGPERPKVRGPIQLDGHKKPKESPSSPAGEHSAMGEPGTTATSSNSTSTDSNSAGSQHKDAA